ncbi:uncharacterized protein LOC132284006 [Cornus florida]|uniref:uncharacterized protein LOC132284006 n=1 Tax=Cornus florida TaxID=4283 RepID=UPI00289A3574|nr:uncharacterized protein LOC132284006 [Cornus florida]
MRHFAILVVHTQKLEIVKNSRPYSVRGALFFTLLTKPRNQQEQWSHFPLFVSSDNHTKTKRQNLRWRLAGKKNVRVAKHPSSSSQFQSPNCGSPTSRTRQPLQHSLGNREEPVDGKGPSNQPQTKTQITKTVTNGNYTTDDNW